MVRTGNITNEAQVLGLLNVQQKLCWTKYTDPKSDTFGNAYQSALAAKYADGYASSITTQDWFKNRLMRTNLVNKAERVLNKTLDIETIDEKGKEDAALLRVQNDSAKFVLKTLAKDEGYNERTEITGANGQPIVFMPMELMEKYGMESSEVVAEDIINNEEEL